MFIFKKNNFPKIVNKTTKTQGTEIERVREKENIIMERTILKKGIKKTKINDCI